MKTLTVLAALALAGCSAKPLASGTELGGILDLRLYYDNDAIVQAASEHCAKYGRKARVTKGRSRIDHTGTFECLA